ncbi:cytochrome oxidase assembly protein ShyY1 [Motilibacter peucedani]|uniref:SURF1-like protein n=1 Tax=Motilibacter peucedani TaxID=598650 RepID=A0A420XK30_9ACTN|nr:SURF1 family protein [Motilibacter peucedani]RKS68049.1 cytochrome oxidase assembly protein ShyY1 [Motilibacter peucedani]
MLRTLRQPRWIWLTLAVVAVSLLFARLGLWQWHRAQAKWASNDAVTTRAHATPVPAQSLLSTDRKPGKRDEWRQVSLTGTYDVAHTVLLRNSVEDGDRGYEVVVPLRPASGPALLVDRGFILANGTALALPAVPPPPSGEVTVVGRVRPPDKGSLQLSEETSTPTVKRLVPREIAQSQGVGPVYDAYVERSSETPTASGTPRELDLPSADVGLNLAYFVQWYAFILVAVGGWWALLRRDVRDAEAAAHAPDVAPGSEAPEHAAVDGDHGTVDVRRGG